jgi:hypothetical protein
MAAITSPPLTQMNETVASARYQRRLATSGSKASGTKRNGLTKVPKTSATATASGRSGTARPTPIRIRPIIT